MNNILNIGKLIFLFGIIGVIISSKILAERKDSLDLLEEFLRIKNQEGSGPSFSALEKEYGDIFFKDIEGVHSLITNSGFDGDRRSLVELWRTISSERAKEAAYVCAKELLSSQDPREIGINYSLINDLFYSRGDWIGVSSFTEVLKEVPPGSGNRLTAYLGVKDPVGVMKIFISRNGVFSPKEKKEIITYTSEVFELIRRNAGLIIKGDDLSRIKKILTILVEKNDQGIDIIVASMMKAGKIRNTFPDINKEMLARDSGVVKKILDTKPIIEAAFEAEDVDLTGIENKILEGNNSYRRIRSDTQEKVKVFSLKGEKKYKWDDGIIIFAVISVVFLSALGFVYLRRSKG
ncbi:MAG: hypothetical protein AB8D78_01685 [Akkermansiaceae bacterium]